MRAQFVRQLGPEQVIHGVGVVAAEGRSQPLVLIDRRLGADSFTTDREPFREPIRPVPLASLPAAREVLARYEAAPDTWVLPVTRPQPLGLSPFATGDALRGAGTRMRGTAGVRVELPFGSGARGLLTAGHVAGTVPGTPLERIRRRRFTRKLAYELLGSVVYGTDPVEHPGRAGYDLAVVRYGASPLIRLRGARVAHLPAFIKSPRPATLLGAMSGRVHGVLIGALCAYGDDVRLWRNSWTMIPSHMAGAGDSGGPIFGADDALLGMLVGGSSWPYSTAMEVQYVQDADSAYRDILAPRGIEIS